MALLDGAFRFLRSPRLAIFLLIALALVTSLGAVFPPGGGEKFLERSLGAWAPAWGRFLGFSGTFRSPLFLALMSLLGLNVATCAAARAGGLLKGPGTSRRRALLDVGMHLSVLVVLAGGLIKGVWGVTLTQYLFPGLETATAFDPARGEEAPIGFTLLLREKELVHYPVRAMIGVRDTSTGEKVALLEVREGGRVRLPREGLDLGITGMTPDGRTLLAWVEREGRREELRLDTTGEGRTGSVVGASFLVLVAWRRDVRDVRGLVAVLEGGREVASAWVRPNAPLAYRGISISITGWGSDQYGNEFLSAQMTRDPGEPVFWTGSLLFAIFYAGFLAFRRRSARPEPAPPPEAGAYLVPSAPSTSR